MIVPVFNAQHTIGQALESVFAQTFNGVEIVVVDDGSGDETSHILEGYGSRIRMVRQGNRGAAAARNTGASVARGNYLAFLDADDTWAPDKLRRSYEALERNPAAVLVFSAFRRILADGGSDSYIFSGSPTMREMLERRSEILPSTVVMRREVFERCGGFCEQFFPNCFEDPYLWILAREHGEFIYIPDCLATYRMRDRKISGSYLRNGRLFLKLVQERYGSKAEKLLAETRNHLAVVALQEALKLVNDGELREARFWLREALRFRASLFFQPDLVWRIASSRNLKRIFRACNHFLPKH